MSPVRVDVDVSDEGNGPHKKGWQEDYSSEREDFSEGLLGSPVKPRTPRESEPSMESIIFRVVLLDA